MCPVLPVIVISLRYCWSDVLSYLALFDYSNMLLCRCLLFRMELIYLYYYPDTLTFSYSSVDPLCSLFAVIQGSIICMYCKFIWWRQYSRLLVTIRVVIGTADN